MAGHRRSDKCLAFRELVSKGVESGTPVHVVLDNVSSCKSALVDE